MKSFFLNLFSNSLFSSFNRYSFFILRAFLRASFAILSCYKQLHLGAYLRDDLSLLQDDYSIKELTLFVLWYVDVLDWLNDLLGVLFIEDLFRFYGFLTFSRDLVIFFSLLLNLLVDFYLFLLKVCDSANAGVIEYCLILKS